MRTRPKHLLGICLIVTAAFAASGAGGPSASTLSEPYRDASGLLVVPARDAAVPEGLRDTYGLAATLSEENPNDFGVPIVANNRVVLTTVGAASSPLASAATASVQRQALDSYLAGRASAPAAGGVDSSKLLSPKMSDADRRLVVSSVSFVSGDRSRSQTDAIKDSVFDLQFDARYQAAGIWGSEVDPLDGAVVLTVKSLTPALAQAIVARYGVDGVHISIAEGPASTLAALGPMKPDTIFAAL